MKISVLGIKALALVCFLLVIMVLHACTQKRDKHSTSQNPSPMVETIRPHIRVTAEECKGRRIEFDFLKKPAQLYIPENYRMEFGTHLIIHFHGLTNVTEHGICNDSNKVLLTVNAGSGSSAYEQLFDQPNLFEMLVDRVLSELEISQLRSVCLSAWSAGYGSVRALLPYYENKIDEIILLDGLHTSYIPEKLVLHDGGLLDSTKLNVFYRFAEKAVQGEKQMLVTHTSIFPGTYASTTECTDYLIRKLDLRRVPMLKEGPVGMQMLAEVKTGGLIIQSYAGNTAPDHIDHLHGLQYFIQLLRAKK